MTLTTPIPTPTTLRSSSIRGNLDKINRYGWTVIDRPGEFAMIPKEQLAIDHDYQRNLKELRVNEYASAWSWVACGALHVALRPNGNWFVFDGQHRLAAALKRSDITTLPCMVFELEMTEEASGFIKVNTRRGQVTTIERFRAYLISRDPNALKVQVLLTGSGVVLKEGGRSPHGLSCAQTLLALMENQEATFRRIWPIVVELLAAATPDTNMPGRLIESLVHVENLLSEKQSLTDKRWRERLNRVGILGLRDSMMRAAALEGRQTVVTGIQGIVYAVNQNLRGERLTLRREAGQ